jgi:hypothetical protein
MIHCQGMTAAESASAHAPNHSQAVRRGSVPSSPDAATSSGDGVSPAAMAAARQRGGHGGRGSRPFRRILLEAAQDHPREGRIDVSAQFSW